MTDTPTEPTPRERMARAYGTDDPEHHDRARLERVAALHDPAEDAEADRIRAIGRTLPLTPAQRVALGYQRGARDAADRMKRTSTTTGTTTSTTSTED